MYPTCGVELVCVLEIAEAVDTISSWVPVGM